MYTTSVPNYNRFLTNSHPPTKVVNLINNIKFVINLHYISKIILNSISFFTFTLPLH